MKKEKNDGEIMNVGKTLDTKEKKIQMDKNNSSNE
jgi:hypothetical protein